MVSLAEQMQASEHPTADRGKLVMISDGGVHGRTCSG